MNDTALVTPMRVFNILLSAGGALHCLPAAKGNAEHWAAWATETVRELHAETMMERDALAPSKLLEEKVARRKVQ